MQDAWFYSVGGQQFGPVPLAEIRRLVYTGQLGAKAPVWMHGAVAPLTADQAVGNAPVGPGDDGMKYIAPTAQTSGMALLAGYLGIFGFFMCPLGPVALVFGILGLRDLKQHPEKNGAGRAWTGIVCGAIQTLLALGWLVLVLLGK